jgi:hypothetical protein
MGESAGQEVEEQVGVVGSHKGRRLVTVEPSKFFPGWFSIKMNVDDDGQFRMIGVFHADKLKALHDALSQDWEGDHG